MVINMCRVRCKQEMIPSDSQDHRTRQQVATKGLADNLQGACYRHKGNSRPFPPLGIPRSKPAEMNLIRSERAGKRPYSWQQIVTDWGVMNERGEWEGNRGGGMVHGV